MSPRFRFLSKVIMIAFSLVAVGSTFSTSVPATAGVSSKVTVCHRTHAVNNPYRRITVARSSVINANGHQTASHDAYSSALYPSGKPNPNVFNKSMTYTPSPEKKWGDIIPPVDVSNDDLPGTPELNYTNGSGDLRGIDIYNGTGAYAGICKTISTSDYVKGEKDAGITLTVIRADLVDQAADEDADALTKCNGDFSTCALATIESLETTTTTAAPTTTVVPTTTNAPTTTVASNTSGATTTTVASNTSGATTTTVASGTTGASTTTIASFTGALKGITWIDMNRNDVHEENEPFLKNTKLVATQDSTVSTKSVRSNAVSAKSISMITDANGYYEVPKLAPGTWTVTAVLSIKELERVFDTSGPADWKATAIVPINGVGIADFAAAGTSTITLSIPDGSASEVVANWAGSDASFCTKDDIAFNGKTVDGRVKLTGVPHGTYRFAISDPCETGVEYMQASVAKSANIAVTYAPLLPRTGANNELAMTLIALVLLAGGAVIIAVRRRLYI